MIKDIIEKLNVEGAPIVFSQKKKEDFTIFANYGEVEYSIVDPSLDEEASPEKIEILAGIVKDLTKKHFIGLAKASKAEAAKKADEDIKILESF